MRGHVALSDRAKRFKQRAQSILIHAPRQIAHVQDFPARHAAELVFVVGAVGAVEIFNGLTDAAVFVTQRG